MVNEENKVVENEETMEATEVKKESKKERKSKKNAEVDALKAEIEKLSGDLAAMKDSHLRTLAEYDNYRKRSQREKEATYGDAKANTLKTLLPVIDNFDRALENQTEDIEVYKKGVEMTITQLKEILKNMEVESFGAVGDEFDPNIHSAVMTVENAELPENSVAAVFEKGYKMGDRILRFATVQVTN